MARRRILFVTSRFPYPLIGGGPLRVFNLISQLSKEFDVTLLTLQNSAQRSSAELSSTGVTNVRCFRHSLAEAGLATAGALLSGFPLNVAYYRSAALSRDVDKLAPEHDLCIFHLIRTSPAWRRQAEVPAVLELCDATGANFAQTAAHGHPLSPWRLLSAIEAPRTVRFERSEAARFDLVTLHTRADAERVGIPPERLLISTQGVNLSALNWLAPNRRHGRAIAMIGKMDFFPNWHGARWFAANVLPLLPEEVRLKIVGDCPAKIRALFKDIPRVDITGRVDSLEDATKDCFVAIAPMMVATGIQNKVLEYFALGLPTVMTPAVASGLLPAAEGGYHVATTEDDWARALRTILSDPESATYMARSSKTYVERCHNWDSIGREYVDRLNRLLGGSA
jgi:glycosyltransferase involved in cell wall biosynthesis